MSGNEINEAIYAYITWYPCLELGLKKFNTVSYCTDVEYSTVCLSIILRTAIVSYAQHIVTRSVNDDLITL